MKLFSGFIEDGGFSFSFAGVELSLEIEYLVFEESFPVGFSIDELSFVLGVIDSECSFAVPLAFEPVSLVEVLAFLCALALDLVFGPGPFVDVSIEVVVDALSVAVAIQHLSFVPAWGGGYLSPFWWMKMPSPW